MENINLPIYRAKKIDSDEYVTGNYNFTLDLKHILATPYIIEIDVSTLAINFPDMIDSQGNKIFASLSENGKGGDMIENYNFNNDYKNQIAIYDNCTLCLVDKDGDTHYLNNIEYDGIKVIGIQE